MSKFRLTPSLRVRRTMRGPDAWLQEHTQYGDLVLTGGSDIVSKTIQLSTRGNYSHAMIVIDEGRVLEAIDYVGESPGGLFATSFTKLCNRQGINRISAFRPRGLDEVALRRAIDDIRSAEPSFDSAGILLLGALRGVEFVQRRLRLTSDRRPRSNSARAHRRLERLVELTGDGLGRMHCGELATRLYTEAGLGLVFATPTFLHLLTDLEQPMVHNADSREQLPRGVLSIASLPRIPRSAEQDPHLTEFASVHELKGRPPSSVAVARQIVRSAVGRRHEQTTPDPADFVAPSDLAKAQPFERLGSIHLDRGKWRTS